MDNYEETGCYMECAKSFTTVLYDWSSTQSKTYIRKYILFFIMERQKSNNN